ncbi:allophanate hydrolase [Enterovibrio norvegicus FF-33]|uniref:allophanate hydrolase n=1 Tax=Enterovibrio norvegicus TaxID=188144 RepID=UPI0002EEFFFB|nr:allophanate hydrolase [Enterovibrio norvegicus]OEE67057.1 allophanate hydrolase [Enterovibrio norvegicus FF-33]
MEFTSIQALLDAYKSGETTPEAYLRQQWKQAKADVNHCWISNISEAQLDGYIKALKNSNPELKPLYGVPFAIKDNIDLLGLPTTAACKEFAYSPGSSAFVVQALIDAGAVPLGKTNLDQFATGLNGTRSPYGACQNSIDPTYISGGSSAGSAVSVALKQVLFSLGTDTAGSGRVPAAFNRLVGMKASIGRISCRGLVPACRTLDCITVFAHSVDDIEHVLPVAGQYDPSDCYARDFSDSDSGVIYSFDKPRIGVPRDTQLAFFGNDNYRCRFTESKAQCEALGAELVDVDFSPFLDAAKLLYHGPWVAERYAGIKAFFDEHEADCDPAIQAIIGGARGLTAVDAFNAQYQLQALKKRCDAILNSVDAILIPTAGNIYTIEEMQADPIQLNTNLGFYTNFMNLLDYAAIAVPADDESENMPFGITLFSDKGTEPKLLEMAKAYTGKSRIEVGERIPESMVMAVCGAHMAGLPLNHQLISRQASFLEKRRSAARYQFFALAGEEPKRPGMVRTKEGGHRIELELWEMPTARFGDFLAGIPSPLGLGKVELDDGTWVTGFICEEASAAGGRDISHFGSWRGFLASKSDS